MHNAGLMHYEGVGGPQNLAVAADWFKRAAELGLADSQFNIGQLYELGLGVPQNSAEAYKWYLLASRQGSEAQRAQAKTAAEKVRLTLPADARATAERVAAEFAARPAAPVRVTAADADLSEVQSALRSLGYYKGEPNGVASSALRTALQQFQRDNGLAQSGEVDAATVARLQPFLR
jgi:localization factor PodJL